MAKAASNPLSRFTLAAEPVKPRIIGASFGEVGTGKTHWWLGAPGPIVVFSFDKGLEGVIEKHQGDKEIYFRDYEWSPTADLSQSEAIELRDSWADDFEAAIQSARTVLIDKETDLWELFRYAEFGSPNDAPKNYAALNQRYRKYMNMPKALDINFGCIQSLKDVWGSKTNNNTGRQSPFNTGERARAGFGELEGLVHVNLEHVREGGKFYIKVGKARGPGSVVVQDETYEVAADANGFVEFACMLFPETEAADWE